MPQIYRTSATHGESCCAGDESLKIARMRETIDELFDEPDDAELCDKVFVRLVDHYGESADLSRVAESHRIVLCVWGARGIIGNGGFHYLFSNNLEGDPHFELTAAAFKAINCEPALEAFRRVFALFPEGRPPADQRRRLPEYLAGDGSKRTPIDELFWSSGDAINRQLATFIRSHRNSFANLDEKGATLTGQASATPAKAADEGSPLLIKQLQRLTHWSRVAVAARCARDILPVFHDNWPHARARHLGSVLRCIALAEESAVRGKPAAGILTARTNALVTIGTAVCVVSGEPRLKEKLPADGNAAMLAATVARAALKACEAAEAHPRRSCEIAHEVVAGAAEVVQNVGDSKLINQFSSYLDFLERAAKERRWTHKSPIPVFALEYEAILRSQFKV